VTRARDHFVQSLVHLGDVPAFTPWKVTARYEVQVEPSVSVRCVRVRSSYRANALVLHFSEAEFKRLFGERP
jgi:hypothetical protein